MCKFNTSILYQLNKIAHMFFILVIMFILLLNFLKLIKKKINFPEFRPNKNSSDRLNLINSKNILKIISDKFLTRSRDFYHLDYDSDSIEDEIIIRKKPTRTRASSPNR